VAFGKANPERISTVQSGQSEFVVEWVIDLRANAAMSSRDALSPISTIVRDYGHGNAALTLSAKEMIEFKRSLARVTRLDMSTP
jgi:hypothetical protein